MASEPFEALHSAEKPGRWWHRLADGRVQCDLCPRACVLHDGQKAFCFVRENVGGEMKLMTYGRSTGFCVDPIEKKPLYHFLPGSNVFSFGTAGCNLGCKFCQNWGTTKAREVDVLCASASPDEIAEAAQRLGCASVAFTYNDPVIFAEYAMDAADACHARGLATVAVTAGYIMPTPRAELFSKIDAVNVDLKAFSEDFYWKLSVAHLAPVLDTIRYLVRETKVWTEVTNLIIPGFNDKDDDVARLLDWFLRELGPDVPLHVTAFHPAYKMMNVRPTPIDTLRRIRTRARSMGLRYVYTGNVLDPEGGVTTCAQCGESLIERSRMSLTGYLLDRTGACPACKARLPGVFAAQPEHVGELRIPHHVAL
ncbi:MAG: AmmeMemoRadiSam system radical SAM enzyme [Deltaproteobacteria bacterium]|nr:AmmeMemoRadiSam system radical SAM enzyme [Deltaproteobacteria bacterium]